MHVLCLRHGCWLRVKCPRCNASTTWDSGAFERCGCGQSLSRVSAYSADAASLQLVRELDEIAHSIPLAFEVVWDEFVGMYWDRWVEQPRWTIEVRPDAKPEAIDVIYFSAVWSLMSDVDRKERLSRLRMRITGGWDFRFPNPHGDALPIYKALQADEEIA